MKIDFPVRITNRSACIKFLEAVEEEYPDMKWVEGQKPASYIPKKFPTRIYYSGRLWCDPEVRQ